LNERLFQTRDATMRVGAALLSARSLFPAGGEVQFVQFSGDAMKQVPITDARDCLGMLANRAGLRGERIVLTRNGKPLAAIVPFEDADFMEKREDEMDVAEAERILAKGEPTVPCEQVKKELGLHGIHRRHQPRRAKANRKTA
jgi:prevent-host-death family protein